MKKYLLLLCCSFAAIACFAQKNNDLVYFFKEDWTFAKDYDAAYYFMQVTKENDSTYIGRSYTKTGPMVKWETFKDKDIEMPHGKFAYYNSSGTIDSSGFVFNGKKDSTWYYSDASGKTVLKEEFKRGRLVQRTNYLTNKIIRADGTEEDIKKPETKKDTSTKKDDKVFTVIQSPAEYTGGLASWNKYLMKNLKTPDRFTNLYKKGSYKGTVIVTFIINKEGFLSDPFIEKSCEWSTDTEAIRVLKASPKWKPAIQNGRNVIYRHRQSLTFQVSDE